MLGFSSTKSTLLASYHHQKLPHAILLHGKKGIGKASFAKKFCGDILGGKNDAHPDLLLIEKEAEKKEINVEKIRQISGFANQTSAISENKFIIIDSACELNKSAANALLKVLEEPRPNNFLILISHNLSRVLPTIRSRCHIIKIPNFSLENFSEVLQQKNIKFSADEMKFLAEICDNSPAEAINFGADLTRVYQLFLRSIINKKIGEELLKKISDKNFSFTVFEKICEFFFNRLLKNLNKNQLHFFFDEKEVFQNLIQNFSAEKIFTIIDESLISLHKTAPLYLDKKLCVLNIFNRLCHE